TMEHVHSEHVAAHPDRVFAALANPEGLAQFVPQLASVRHGDGDRVEVEARYEGRTQRGEAYFRADEDERKVEWGTGGGYRGWMQVIADGDGWMLTLGCPRHTGSTPITTSRRRWTPSGGWWSRPSRSRIDRSCRPRPRGSRA